MKKVDTIIDKINCESCPAIEKCCKSQGHRIIRRHIKEELNENARKRSSTNSKQNHRYRYAMYKKMKKAKIIHS